MKFGLIVVIALIASVFAAHFLLQDPGYVVINFRGYLVEMSVPVLLALFALVVLAGWMLLKVYRAPRRLGESVGRMRSGRAGQKLTRGMIQIAEGNFARGEKMLARAAGDSDAPLLNYLQAARAAHLLGADERRDSWLKQAFEQMPEASNAVLLTQAEFQLDQGQYEAALATLRRIQDAAPNHSHALALLGRLYFRLEDWKHLGELLPRLNKHARVEPSLLKTWTLRVFSERLQNVDGSAALDDAWRSVPKTLRNEASLLETYFSAMVRVGDMQRAEKGITAQLKREWIPALTGLFATIDSANPGRQLKRAEGWLSNHPNDPELLLAAARLCLKNELWGKARSYLETAISLQPSPDAYQEYGRLLNRLGEGDAAADAYRAGLGMVSRSPLPAIPDLRPETGAADTDATAPDSEPANS